VGRAADYRRAEVGERLAERAHARGRPGRGDADDGVAGSHLPAAEQADRSAERGGGVVGGDAQRADPDEMPRRAREDLRRGAPVDEAAEHEQPPARGRDRREPRGDQHVAGHGAGGNARQPQREPGGVDARARGRAGRVDLVGGTPARRSSSCVRGGAGVSAAACREDERGEQHEGSGARHWSNRGCRR
jgi:hypothetical protein